MKFIIERSRLLKSLQQVIGAVERRQTMPTLANVLLKLDDSNLELTTTDLEIELIARIDAVNTSIPGSVTASARKFLDICKALPESAELHLARNGEQFEIKSGRSRFNLATLPTADFPSLDALTLEETFSVSTSSLQQALNRTSFSMAQQDVRYYLNGLLIELLPGQLRAVATDGHRLSICDTPVPAIETGGKQILVPRKGVMELSRLLSDIQPEVEVSLAPNHLRVESSQLRFTTKLIDGRFPDYQRVIPKDCPYRLTADTKALRQALSRVAILSNEKYRGVRLSLGKDLLRVQSQNPEQEEAEEEIVVEYAGGDLEIGFNVSYLLDVLGVIESESVQFEFGESSGSCVIQGSETTDCQYVVMPMRL